MSPLRNRTHIILTNALNAASEIQTAMCRFDEDHHGQMYLIDALQNLLIIAEECRQGLKDEANA